MSPKKYLLISLLLVSLVALAGCTVLIRDLNGITGSGVTVSQTYSFADFSEVEIQNAFTGTITQGDTYSVEVTVDDNLVDRLKVEQNGNRVTIGFQELTMLDNATWTYAITMPTLTALDLSGASVATLSGFDSAEPFTTQVSGASRLEGDLSSGDAAVNASGASRVTLNGAGGNVAIEASGASTVNLGDFATADADVQASGASTIVVNTTGRLDANASGASTIRYRGEPTLGTLDISGASNVEPE